MHAFTDGQDADTHVCSGFIPASKEVLKITPEWRPIDGEMLSLTLERFVPRKMTIRSLFRIRLLLFFPKTKHP